MQLKECQNLGAAQRLMGKLDAICASAYGMCEHFQIHGWVGVKGGCQRWGDMGQDYYLEQVMDGRSATLWEL
jgi:hypothetical protein